MDPPSLPVLLRGVARLPVELGAAVFAAVDFSGLQLRLLYFATGVCGRVDYRSPAPLVADTAGPCGDLTDDEVSALHYSLCTMIRARSAVTECALAAARSLMVALSDPRDQPRFHALLTGPAALWKRFARDRLPMTWWPDKVHVVVVAGKHSDMPEEYSAPLQAIKMRAASLAGTQNVAVVKFSGCRLPIHVGCIAGSCAALAGTLATPADCAHVLFIASPHSGLHVAVDKHNMMYDDMRFPDQSPFPLLLRCCSSDTCPEASIAQITESVTGLGIAVSPYMASMHPACGGFTVPAPCDTRHRPGICRMATTQM